MPVTNDHNNLLHDINALRTLVSGLIGKLQEEVENKEEEHHLPLWGEKENAVSILVKLTAILSKLEPLEQKIASRLPKQEMVLEEEDKQIIARFIHKIKHSAAQGLEIRDK